MSQDTSHIRRAELADAAGLATCVDAAYAKYADRISDIPDVSAGIGDEIANNQVWVIEEKGAIIAGLFLIAKDDFVKLANLAVHPDHDGKGLGRQLMDLAEREAVRQGYFEMRLNTHIAMPENIALYRHFGWHETVRSGNTVSMMKCPASS